MNTDVFCLLQVGRVPIDAPKVTGHGRPVLDIEWNPFNDQEIASSSEDGSIKIWHIPEDGLSMDLDEYLVDLRGHTRKVNIIRWHPCAEGVIASAAHDSEVRIWDIVDDREAATILKGHPDTIFSLSFNYNGSLLASTCKDKKIRVIDPRAGRLVAVSSSYLRDNCLTVNCHGRGRLTLQPLLFPKKKKKTVCSTSLQIVKVAEFHQFKCKNFPSFRSSSHLNN